MPYDIMVARRPDSKDLGSGVILDYALCFPHYADILFVPGQVTPTRLWKISERGLKSLDIQEGVDIGSYKRVNVSVADKDGREVRAIAYAMTEDYRNVRGEKSGAIDRFNSREMVNGVNRYQEIIKDGYRESGFAQSDFQPLSHILLCKPTNVKTRTPEYQFDVWDVEKKSSVLTTITGNLKAANKDIEQFGIRIDTGRFPEGVYTNRNLEHLTPEF